MALVTDVAQVWSLAWELLHATGVAKKKEKKRKKRKCPQYLLIPVSFFSFFCLGPYPRHMEVPGFQGPNRAVAAGLHHSHSNAGSEPCLQPTLQLTVTPDPSPTERGQGLNPSPHSYWLGS